MRNIIVRRKADNQVVRYRVSAEVFGDHRSFGRLDDQLIAQRCGENCIRRIFGIAQPMRKRCTEAFFTELAWRIIRTTAQRRYAVRITDVPLIVQARSDRRVTIQLNNPRRGFGRGPGNVFGVVVDGGAAVLAQW